MNKIISKEKYQNILLMLISDPKEKDAASKEDMESLVAAYEASKSSDFDEVEAINVGGKFTFKPILTKPLDYFNKCMDLVLDSDIGSKDSDDGEKFADQQLLVASNAAMALKLHMSRLKGRHGWWSSEVCSVDDLRSMRNEALNNDDHVSVLNFTAMIAMRESFVGC